MSNIENILNDIKSRISVQNDPFPFFFINNFLPAEIAKKAEEEFIKFSDLKKAGNERYQKTKLVFNKLNLMPENIKKIINIF